jgi:hypothetical protein
MSVILRILILTILWSATALGSGFITIADETSIPWPDDWYLGSDSLTYPFQLIYHNDSAEIVVYKSRITEAEEIRDHVELKEAVDLVADDVIGALHESQIYTSTGYFDNYRAIFVLEFKSSDSLSGLPVRHRLAGILYRLPDDGQLLFTIWGKAAESIYERVRPAMEMVQEGFAYQGTYEESVFPPQRRSWWPAVLIALAAAGLLFVFLRKRHRGPAQPAIKPHFWTCQCGRLNHDSNTACRRCGRVRPDSSSPVL